MRCEEWSERLAGRVTDVPGDSDPGLERHLESCSRCRAELSTLRETWEELARLPEPDVPTEPMRARLRSAVPASNASRRRTGLFLAGRAAAAALIAVAAFLAGRFWNPPAEAAPPDARPRYLLLLHERPGSAGETPEQARQVVEQYKEWARRLRAQGRLVGGEKLSDAGTLLSSSREPVAVARPDVGGYFVIRAATPAEALEIARSCPHVGRGGTVELRPIEDV